MATVSAHCLVCGANKTFMILLRAYTLSGHEVFAMVCGEHRDEAAIVDRSWRHIVEVRTR